MINRVLGPELDLLRANGGRLEINLQLFADDTALLADSDEKLCRLVSEFGKISLPANHYFGRWPLHLGIRS